MVKYFIVNSTRKGLPFCEAIDVEKVNIGNIVWPGTNLKAGTNQMLILLTWNFSMIALNSACLPTSNLETTSKY